MDRFYKADTHTNISSIRTLFIISADHLYPPLTGTPMRNWQNINIMIKFGAVGIFFLSRGNSDCPQNIPHIDVLRTYNLTKLKHSIWEKLELWFWWLHPRRYRPITLLYRKAIAQDLEKLLAEFRPDLVFARIDSYRYLSIIKRYGCRLILDEHNVEAITLKQFYSARSHLTQNRKLTLKEKIEVFLDLSQIKSVEYDLIHKADQVWTCSEIDNQLLQDVYGRIPNTQVIPNGLDVAHYDCVRLGKFSLPEGLEKKQQNLLYCGKFSYYPNAVAVDLLIDQIFPHLCQVDPDCCLILVGWRPTQRMLAAAARDSRIIVTGEVPDIRPYLAAAGVMVVPLRHGGGTRLKILEAFASRCPVISSAKGAEGLKAQDGKHLLIRNEIEAIIEGVCQLWSDPTLGQTLADSAYKLVSAEYSWSAVEHKIESALGELF